MLRKFILLAAIGTGLAGCMGCLKKQACPDPSIRMDQLINQSEGAQQNGGFQFNEPPSHLTPKRITGGI